MNTPRMNAWCGLSVALFELTFSASGAAPLPPENLRAAWVDNKAAVLTWSASTDAESYKVYRYDSQEHLIADLGERVIRPAETKVQELRGHVR